MVHQIRAALEGNFHVDVDFDFGGNTCIKRAALRRIELASLVICLLDDLTPNVTFEYGYSEALHKPCIPMLAIEAKVNVKSFFEKEVEKPCNLFNPKLDVDEHFSDFRNTVYCRYDHRDPAALRTIISEQLEKQDEEGTRLDRRILQTWVDLLRKEYGEEDRFEPVFQYILRTEAIRLGIPLFATRRRHEYEQLLADAFRGLLRESGDTG